MFMKSAVAKRITIGVAAAFLLGAASPASADPWDHRGERGGEHHEHERHEHWQGGERHDRGDWPHYAWGRSHDRVIVVPAPPPWFESGPAYVYRPRYAPRYYAVPPVVVERPIACHRDVVGGLIGGVAGGVLGNQLAPHQGRGVATLGGAIIGALIGGAVGQAMDLDDQACIGQVLEYAPTNRVVQWSDPAQGAFYQVVPLNGYQPGPGRYCREYQTTVTIGGEMQQAYGTACRQPDGSWRPAN